MEALDRRLTALERQVFGGTSAQRSELASADGAVPSLVSMAKEFGNAVEQRDRVAPLMRRTQELDKYLDPSFLEEYGVPASVKVDLILSREQELREIHDMLEKVQNHKDAINGEVFQRVTEFQPKILELAKVHIDQENKAQGCQSEVLELVEQYNDIMATLTKSFMRFDQTLKDIEEKSAKK